MPSVADYASNQRVRYDPGMGLDELCDALNQGLYIGVDAGAGATPTISSAIISFLQSGIAASDAKARTVAAKLSEVQVSVMDADGVLGDDSNDDTTGINNALGDAEHVHFSANTYKVSGNLNIVSGLREISGDGMFATTIKQYGTLTSGTGTLYAESSSSSTYIEGLYIHDLTLDGQVASLSFSAFQHLLSMNGVKDVIIERVRFLGFRGDGFYLGSGASGGSTERHNINVTLKDCLFDGVNSDNRNGASIIDCDGFRCSNNTFRNCTKSTMPGPIDVEPDAQTFHVVKNIEIVGNRIESFSGGQGITVYTGASALTAPMFGVKIKDNFIAGATKSGALAIYVGTAETISASAAPMQVEISGNEVWDSASASWQVLNVKYLRDVKIHHNTFRGGSTAAIGDDTTASVTIYDAEIYDNHFYRNGNASGACVLASVSNLRFDGNIVDSPNAGTSTIGVRFVGTAVTTVSSNVAITNNTFIKGASQTTSIGATSHSFTPNTNIAYGNRVLGGTLTNQFLASDLGDPDIGIDVVLKDDFMVRALSDYWTGRVGTDPQCVTPTPVALASGAVRLTAGDDAAASMAVNGCQLEGNINWGSRQGNLAAEFRVKVNAITDVCIFVGFTDQVSALEMPFTLGGGDALTSNATDAVGVLFDTAADTDEWCLVGVATNVDATKQFAGVAPTAGTYETWRIEVAPGEVATFYRNGTLVGTAMSAAVTAFVNLAPVVAIFSRTTATRLMDVDFIRVHQKR